MKLHYYLLHFSKEDTEDSTFNYLLVTYIKYQFCVSKIFTVEKKKCQPFGTASYVFFTSGKKMHFYI